MREILFRGKRTDNGEWIEGCLVCDAEMEDSYIVNRENTKEWSWCYDYREVDPETVCQYTGRTDIKKVKIFENDIVSVCLNGKEKHRFVIKFGQTDINGCIGFYCTPANDETQVCMNYGLRNDICYWLDNYECEVLGNIFDNPELLEV